MDNFVVCKSDSQTVAAVLELSSAVFTGEAFQFMPETSDVFDVLVAAGVFSSKSQARKNWKLGGIQTGLTVFARVGKMKRNIAVWVFNPTLGR